MTLFASFASNFDAERAAAALIDRGAREDDLSVISHQRPGAVEIGEGESKAEEVAKHGVTATTGADAAYGAAKGLSIGAGLGVLGAIAAAILVPGVGLVAGAGALATAIAGSAAAGTVAGGLVGYLKDQGMGDEVAASYHATIEAGGSILALQLPTGDLDETVAESILVKYGASGVFTSYPSATTEVAPLPTSAPRVVPSEPLESMPPAGVTEPLLDPARVVVTHSDPATGYATEGYIDDVTTGLRRPVLYNRGQPYYDTGRPAVAIPPGTPNLGFAAASATALPLGDEVPIGAVTPTRSDPATGLALEGYVEDSVTGVRRAVRFDHGRAYYVG